MARMKVVEGAEGRIERLQPAGVPGLVPQFVIKMNLHRHHAAVMENGRLIRFGIAREILEATVHPMAQQRSDDNKVQALRGGEGGRHAADLRFSSNRKGAKP